MLGRDALYLHFLAMRLPLRVPASCKKSRDTLRLLPGRGLLPAFRLIPRMAATNGSLEQSSPCVPATSFQNGTDDGNVGQEK